MEIFQKLPNAHIVCVVFISLISNLISDKHIIAVFDLEIKPYLLYLADKYEGSWVDKIHIIH